MVDYQVRNLLGATGIKSEPPFAPPSLLSRLMGAPSGVMRLPPSHHHQLKDRSSEEEDKGRDAGKEFVSQQVRLLGVVDMLWHQGWDWPRGKSEELGIREN